MKCCNNLRRTLCSLLVLAVVGTLTFMGCTKVDDTLGSDYIPNGQEMKMGIKRFAKNEQGSGFLETRLYRTDSIIPSNLGNGYIGTMRNDTFGLRTAGYLTQYLPGVLPSDTAGFGYRPIFDSAVLVISVADYAGDTLTPVRYNVYEVTSNDYLLKDGTLGDTTFYVNFDPTSYIDPDPAFTFTFPDGTSSGPSSTRITMQPTERGLDLVRRLMLLDGKFKDSLEIYSRDSLWVSYFKGLCILPAEDATSRGNLFSLTLKNSGFTIYGRNRNRIDPTLIQDTTRTHYYFFSEGAEYGNVSVNMVRHEYAGSKITPSEIDENADRPTVATGYIEGLGGVVTELTFTDEFFAELQAVYEKENAESDNDYTSLAVNQALLYVYLLDGDYDWSQINVGTIIPWLDASAPRLGMYVDYKQITGIPDYYYTYEKLYDTELAYGGYLNRSLGCYVMDISAYIQTIWNNYQEVRDKPASEREIEYRTVYLGPEAYGLYSFPYTSVQGMEAPANNAPIKLDVTYTMIK